MKVIININIVLTDDEQRSAPEHCTEIALSYIKKQMENLKTRNFGHIDCTLLHSYYNERTFKLKKKVTTTFELEGGEQ